MFRVKHFSVPDENIMSEIKEILNIWGRKISELEDRVIETKQNEGKIIMGNK